MSILQESADAAMDNQPEPTQSPPKIDLLSCPPEELAAWLLAHRFEDNAMDVASFLLNCTSTLPNAEEISAQLLGGGSDDDDDDEEEGENEAGESDENNNEEDAKPAVEAEPVAKPNIDPQSQLLQSIRTSQPQPSFAQNNEIEVSCTNPRGKFLLSIYNNGIVLINPKKRDEEQIPISATNVKHVIWFRKPEDYKKMKQLSKNGGNGKSKGVPGHMVLICLEEADGIMFRKKPLKQVCFQLPSYPSPSSADDVNDDNNKQLTEEDWWNGLSSALFSGTKDGIIRVHDSMEKPAYLNCRSGFVFHSEGEPGSTTTTEDMPYVGCYQGFNDGALFPLREGVLFFKPPLFVPRSKLASISCGRGSGGSRYVDMVVQLHPADEEGNKKKKQSDTLEFTNIHRDELTGLNDYIHKTLIPAMQMDANGTEDDSGDDDDADEAVAEVVNSSDDDEDGDADDGSDDEEERSNKRRPSRAASKSAREITRAALKGKDDASSDESDEFEEEDSDDSDESVVSDGETTDSSADEEVEKEEMDNDSDGSDYDDRKPSKKARVE